MRRRRKIKFMDAEPLQGKLGQKEALRRLVKYLAPLKLPIIVGLVFTFVLSAINLGQGKLAKELFDVLDPRATPGATHVHAVDRYVGLAFLLFVIRAVVTFITHYAWAYANNRLTLRLRNEVFAHLQSMSVSFFDHRKTGQLMSSLSNDVPQVTDVLDAIRDLITAPIVVVGGIALLFYVNWQLALISCICLPPIAFIIVRATRLIERYTEQLQNHRARVLDIAAETLAAIRIVKSFGNEEYEKRRFARHSSEVARTVLRTARIRHSMRPLVELLGSTAILLVLWYGIRQTVQAENNLTFGSLVWIVMIIQQVAGAARECAAISNHLAVAGVAADRVFTLLDYKSDVQEKPDAIVLKDVAGRLEFDHVSFSYSAGIPVLEDISFAMEAGEVVAVVGPTGAGKTTIAGLIPRFYDVTSGRLTVDGIDIRDCTITSLRDQIGIVPQDTVLFAGTLKDNIAYGRLGATEEEIIEAAKTANAWEFIERQPQGLKTPVGERGVTLSGGQRQRIAIARAVLRDPKILILDEATSSLDSQSEALVQDALQKLVAHRTTLVIAHRLSTVRNADKILVIKEGHIVEAGRHEELLVRGGVYSELYKTQFRRKENESDLDSLD